MLFLLSNQQRQSSIARLTGVIGILRTGGISARLSTESIVYGVGVTTQQHAGLQLLEELIGADVDAVQCAKPVCEVFLHRVETLVLSLTAAGQLQQRVITSPTVGFIF